MALVIMPKNFWKPTVFALPAESEVVLHLESYLQPLLPSPLVVIEGYWVPTWIFIYKWNTIQIWPHINSRILVRILMDNRMKK